MGVRDWVAVILKNIWHGALHLLVTLACGGATWWVCAEVTKPLSHDFVAMVLGWTQTGPDGWPHITYLIPYALTLHIAAAVGSFASAVFVRPAAKWRIVLPVFILYVIWANMQRVAQVMQYRSLTSEMSKTPEALVYKAFDGLSTASFSLLATTSLLAIPVALAAGWLGWLLGTRHPHE